MAAAQIQDGRYPQFLMSTNRFNQIPALQGIPLNQQLLSGPQPYYSQQQPIPPQQQAYEQYPLVNFNNVPQNQGKKE